MRRCRAATCAGARRRRHGGRSEGSTKAGESPARHAFLSIRPSASAIASAFAGRTRRATSFPSFRKISVGHSLTPNERPSLRPLPSSTLICRTSG
ncbi:hypothetical protein ebA5335 [Aromatoleum aromaticum EbN1]|uniref:Uncharacterized protein n=1 Tax=Aromatoleum aromaticum (strain DSM 19018 / LMG 30748 / EbN1) TaxID=76114 RepID=Q5P0K5_AROAE|nr:hypothetical protein ebA5335 [Aromatoleum aromaticum EbN1]